MTIYLAAPALTPYLAAPAMTIYLAAPAMTPYLAAPAMTMWMVVMDLTFAKVIEEKLTTVRLVLSYRKSVGGGVWKQGIFNPQVKRPSYAEATVYVDGTSDAHI
jgi:hypothetical protein